MKANEFIKGRANQTVTPSVKPVPTQREVALRKGTALLVGGLAMYVGIMGLLGRRVI